MRDGNLLNEIIGGEIRFIILTWQLSDCGFCQYHLMTISFIQLLQKFNSARSDLANLIQVSRYIIYRFPLYVTVFFMIVQKVSSIPPNDKIRNHLVADVIEYRGKCGL